MGTQLILSLFPGIGLLDMAFEQEGFCVVRGPDLLWGGDIHTFHPVAGRFDGIIGGPPCQAFSRLQYLVKYNGLETAQNLIPEFERCVEEAQPTWFLMENVPNAPLPDVRGYLAHSQVLNNRWYGGVQHRTRRISFGTRDGHNLDVVPDVFEPIEWAPAVCASGGLKPGTTITRSPKAKQMGYKTRENYKQSIEWQGLPDDFTLPGFTTAGAIKAVGNGVPLPLGRAIARAVREASQ